jgi:hypothetical protein
MARTASLTEWYQLPEAVLAGAGWSDSRAGRKVGGKAEFVREYATAMRCDVFVKLYSSAFAARVRFDHGRSQTVIFGM